MFVNTELLDQIGTSCPARASWRPFPDIADRDGWQAVKSDARLGASITAILACANKVPEGAPEQITGTLYMDFMRTGGRSAYESVLFQRRAELSHLVIAECLINDGRFLDRIIDNIWATLGEVYWCVPAHNFAGTHEMVLYKAENPWRADDPLPVPGDDYLDLFHCETAAILAEACYLLKPLLTREVPSLYHLVNGEVERRTLAKFEGPGRYGWFQGKNNWTPWCAHNLLLAASYIFDDTSRLASFATKLFTPMQCFYDLLGDSGSCIEGPAYWNVSAARLMGFIDLTESRFGADLQADRNQKFRAFGTHLEKLHIGGDKFVNFADGSPAISLDHGLLSRYAGRIGSQHLANLIWQDVDRVAEIKLQRAASGQGFSNPNRQILIHLTRLLFWTPDIQGGGNDKYQKSIWLDDMEVMLARGSDEADKGLTLSCIAGSNDLALNHHSHNDVGHFSLYCDGEPVIIDLGRGSYSKATFSNARYEKWFINSSGHNVPQINGLLQRHGAGAMAVGTEYNFDGRTSELRFDTARAYFDKAGSNRIERTISFDHEKAHLQIADQISLTDELTSYVLPIHVSDREITVTGLDTCSLTAGQSKLLLKTENLSIERVEPVVLTDPVLRDTWGNRVFRIVLTGQDLAAGRFLLSITLDTFKS